MQVLSKIVLLSGAVKAALAHDGHDNVAAAGSGTPDLVSIEVGQLLATSCKPLTIYTHECQVVTVQPSTTGIFMTTEVTPTPEVTSATVETKVSSTAEATTTSEEVPEATEPVVSAACTLKQFYMELAVFLFGIAVLYTV
ncbi:hypothetical protein B0T11DRAFT_77991 [Plectosphaerella cucumerina]|uniref:Uncharacterized protein n=1 Tax=Plectosphaerella cucumerina TaxID=40658 RepID=A0A8K0X3W1_9PEZI|nr:hypothetical protein B0T11DRAFT_77991 [Plectosphaerella cucumerina]